MKILNDGAPYEEFENFLAEHISKGKLSFDGIFCVTDKLAYSIVGTLRKLGQKVPEDVQVIGFDGVRQFGEKDYVCSTIVQPLPDIAEMCVNLLLQENTSLKPPLICLPVSYAYGGTTRESADGPKTPPQQSQILPRE
ncbi:MAG: substrate-binding domain-containing protein [Roseburia sp.]|nr:substrate-binding domain-containing protein [Roseburia sp.]MCM1241863.1 substrate-binding domain-containing protein [Roseburia sp.]